MHSLIWQSVMWRPDKLRQAAVPRRREEPYPHGRDRQTTRPSRRVRRRRIRDFSRARPGLSRMMGFPRPSRSYPFVRSAGSSKAFSSTLQPVVRSTGVASSSSLWLMPPTQGTNTMALGAIRAM
jgi:hypothetical protein